MSITCVIVDDEKLARDLLREYIQQIPDMEIVGEASKGKEAVEVIDKLQPDLIFLDLNLPDISGHEVLTRLQQSAITRDIPVVVVSADATPSQVERLLTAGAREYLTKPLNIGLFLHVLDETLSQKGKTLVYQEETS